MSYANMNMVLNSDFKDYIFDYNINCIYFFLFITLSSFLIVIIVERNNHNYTLIPNFDIDYETDINDLNNISKNDHYKKDTFKKDLFKDGLFKDELFRDSHFKI